MGTVFKREVGKMEKNTFSIPNISCGHCVMTIKNELGELEGVKSVEGDPEKKVIRVEWEEPATLEDIELKLEDINYPASS
jgi:copper chaperone